jgi:hypothetical protein
MGFGLPDDRIHGPNEKFHLPNFHKGIETSIRFLAELGAHRGGKPSANTSNGSSGKTMFATHEERIP